MRITVTFDTDDANTALPAKVIAGVETMLNERGLDMGVHPTAGGIFHDLTVTITDDRDQTIWGSVFEGAANNEGGDCTACGRNDIVTPAGEPPPRCYRHTGNGEG